MRWDVYAAIFVILLFPVAGFFWHAVSGLLISSGDPLSLGSGLAGIT